MFAEKLYEDIKDICASTPTVRSDRQRKDNIYRAIKARVAYYRELAEKDRKKQGWGGSFNRPSDDEIKIHLLGSMVVKNPITDSLSSQEFINYILDVTSMAMTGVGTNGTKYNN